MALDLILMNVSLSIGMLSSAYSGSLYPMLGVVFASIGTSIWRLRLEEKARKQLGKPFKGYAYSTGAVYVAVSKSSGWMKIGLTSTSAEQREKTLNGTREGGLSDWSMQIYRPHIIAGRLEIYVQKALKKIKIPSKEIPERKYKKTGRGSREIYKLDIGLAEQALRKGSVMVLLAYLATAPIFAVLSPMVIGALVYLLSL